MSIAGITNTDLLYSSQNVRSQMQEMRQEFQQLGQDLQSGNMSAAQSDFATLTQMDPNLASTSATSSTASATSSTNSNPIEQAFAQLAQDLKSGNLSAAQQDFSTIQQDMQSAMAAHGHHRHHHHSESRQNSSQENPISQLFSQLGQDLQSGNLTAAQQDFSTIQQQFQQYGQNSIQVPPEVGPNAVSVNA